MRKFEAGWLWQSRPLVRRMFTGHSGREKEVSQWYRWAAAGLAQASS